MPAITTIVAIAGVAAAVGGTVAQKQSAQKRAAAAKKQSDKAQAAALAKKPSADTGADVALQSNEKKRKRGRGSLASIQRRESLGAPSASAVGGL